MKALRSLIVHSLERGCTLLDHVGWLQRFHGKWYWAPQGLGCRLGLATKSCDLDDRWQTGLWR